MRLYLAKLGTLEVCNYNNKVSRTLLKKPQIVICPAYWRSIVHFLRQRLLNAWCCGSMHEKTASLTVLTVLYIIIYLWIFQKILPWFSFLYFNTHIMRYVFVLKIYKESLVDQVYALYYNLLFLKVSGSCSLFKGPRTQPEYILGRLLWVL